MPLPMTWAVPDMTLPMAPASMSARAFWWAPPKEGVRRATDHQIALFRDVFKVEPILKTENERLFRIGVLAGGQDRLGDGVVHFGDG